MSVTTPRQSAVLFAKLTNSAALRVSQGEQAAEQAIASCLNKLCRSVQSSKGRVVKTVGDSIMAVFTTPAAAAFAASGLQYAMEEFPAAGTIKLALGIGFHYGDVIQNGEDLFGGTVNLAARLSEKADAGDIITTRESSDRLAAMFRPFIRPPYRLHLKGFAEEVEVCELIWREGGEQTFSSASRTPVAEDLRVLRLRYRDRETLCRRHNELINLGREVDCEIVILDKMASRHHCTIERRQDKFILADHSANGTFVTPEGSSEILLRREEMMLVKHGWIAFGQPREAAEDVAEYFCE